MSIRDDIERAIRHNVFVDFRAEEVGGIDLAAAAVMALVEAAMEGERIEGHRSTVIDLEARG